MASVDRLERALVRPVSGPLVEKVVVIPERADFVQVVHQLTAAKLVRDDGWLGLYAERLRAPTQLVPGEYALSSDMSLMLQVSRLERGEVMTHTVNLTPGSTMKEMIRTLAAAGLGQVEALTQAAEDPELLAGVGPEAQTLEGFLLPDVYTLPKGLPAKQLLGQLLKRQAALCATLEGATKRPRYDVIRIASLVELSGVPQREQRVYAAMLYNRLDKKVPLDHPSSADYGTNLGLEPANNPYRTDRQPGLPPTPICNPGADALQAAFHPVKTDALFKVRREDGSHYYCPDRECVRAAERARQGLSPTFQPTVVPVPLGADDLQDMLPTPVPPSTPLVVPGQPLTPEPPSETELGTFDPQQPL